MSKSLVVTIILLFTILAFPVQKVKAYEPSPKNDASIIKKRVDRTDFPLLYLSSPCLEGDAIWLLQAKLHDLGYELMPSGQYDPLTAEIVQLFQTANNMKANGVVNSQVWQKLMYDQQIEPCLTDKNADKDINIIIDLDKHSLTVLNKDKVINKFPVGIGKSSTHSPLGEWKVVNKAMGWGNGFGTRWMGLNVPWGVYGIHGTDKPWSVGRSESHGCIRMYNKDVEILFPLISIGTRVRIMENGKMFPSDLNFKGRKLCKNSTGRTVTYLQTRLKEKGIVFDETDGRYGNMTELAVKYYQIWHGLTPTGEADEETFRSLGMID